MLLTCNRCRITYDVDERLYAQQGYAICEHCQEELLPFEGDFSPPEEVSAQDAQWGQPAQDAQWGAQDAQWGQPAQDAQWGAQDAQWGQPAQDAQWGQPAQDAQWGQPAQDAQWGQPAQDAQWGQPAQDAQWGAQDAQWGQPVQDAQWGQPAQDAQWGQPVQDAQWGQEPQALAQDAQWGQPAQEFAQAAQWGGVQMPNFPDLNQQADEGDRTVALDLSDFDEDAHPVQGPGAPGAWNQAESEAAQWGNAWGDAPGDAPSASPPMHGMSAQAMPVGPQVVVGDAVDPSLNEGMTRHIDLREVQMLYGDKPQFLKGFIQSLPRKAIIIAGATLVFAITLFIVLAILISSPEEKERIVGVGGEVVEKGTPAPPRSFEQVVRSTKAEVPTLLPLDGPELREGVVVGISAQAGVSYNERKIASLESIQSGPRFVESIYEVARKDVDDIEKPIILLFDETLQMSTAFRVMYSIAATGRKVLLGASTSSGITAIDIEPYEWPDYGTYMFPMAPNVTTQLKLTTADLVLRVILGTDPLIVEADGTPRLELRDEIRGGKVVIQNIQPAISKLRAAQRPSMRMTTDGDVTVGTFMRVAYIFLGSIENPNIKRLLLDEVPLR